MRVREQLSTRICKNPKCNNLLLNRQKMYCSRKCSSTSLIRKESCSKALKKKWENKDFITYRAEKFKLANKMMWDNPKYKEKMRKLSSIRLKKQWEDKTFRENQTKRSNSIFKEYRNKSIIKLKEKWINDIEYRNKMKLKASNQLKERWNNIKFRMKMTNIAKSLKNGGYNLLERYKRNHIDKCYLYLIIFNNEFFKVGVSKNMKRPNLFLVNNKEYNPKLLIYKQDSVEKVCECERYIHKELNLPNYLQTIIQSGKSEVYSISYLDKVLNIIKKYLSI